MDIWAIEARIKKAKETVRNVICDWVSVLL